MLGQAAELGRARWYLREIVQLVVDEGLPAVVCIHPECRNIR